MLFACNAAARPAGRGKAFDTAAKGSGRNVAASAPAPVAPAVGPAAAVPSREMCVTAYEGVQVAMKRSTLTEAREQARVCLDAACSSALRSDCATWLAEIDAKQPTIVVEYHDASGVARSDAVVLIDGTKVASVLDGRGIAVDPGAHIVRLEPVGEKPMEQRQLFREGVKLSSVAFSRVPIATLKPDGPLVDAAQRPVPAATWIAGGVGLLGAASFVTFAVWGKVGQNNLDTTCKPLCAEPDVSRVHTRYMIADISLGVSLVGLASAALFYVFRPTARPAAAASLTRGPDAARSVYDSRSRVAFSVVPDVRAVPAGATFGISGLLP